MCACLLPHTRQQTHKTYVVDFMEVMSSEMLDMRCQHLPDPPAVLLRDDELDVIDSDAAADAAAKSKACVSFFVVPTCSPLLW